MRSVWEVLLADLSELIFAELTAEFEGVLLSGTEVILQNGILATSDEAIVVNILNFKHLIDGLAAGGSVFPLGNDWESVGVRGWSDCALLKVASELVLV